VNFITHACLPIVLVSASDIIKSQNAKATYLPNIQYLLIGLGGMLPDVLWPHLSLNQRLNSPTHTIWFLSILLPVVIGLAKWKLKEGYIKFSIWFWVAAILHVVVDGVSGGVNVLYPLKTKIGFYVIPFTTWFIYDIVFVVITTVLLLKIKRARLAI